MPDLISVGFPIADRSPSMTLEATFYVIHIFRMSAFFLIAGFFAHLMFHRKGAREFMRDRMRRILWPLLGFWPVIAPITIAVIVWAAFKANGYEPPKSPEGPQPMGVPMMHLWFLYYLVLFYAVALAAREAIVRTLDRNGSLRAKVDRAVRWLVNGYVAPIVLAVPAAACLYAAKTWPWPGIPTHEVGFTPILSTFVAYGTAFVFGWVLHRQTQLLATLERRWVLHLVLAAVASAAAWHIVGAPMGFLTPVPESVKLLYASVYMFATWCWVFALLGAALKFFSAPSTTWRYLADSSYWMYLIHMPLLFALQTLMMDWNLHWTVKFPLLLAVTLGLLLWSYHLMVRRTWLGKWLNGRKYPRQEEPAIAKEAV
jgi:peptidoglycan/LPS O-acetylase OafA/YrhL